MAIGLCSEPFNFNSGSVCSDIVLGLSKQASGCAALIYMYVGGRKGKNINYKSLS